MKRSSRSPKTKSEGDILNLVRSISIVSFSRARHRPVLASVRLKHDDLRLTGNVSGDGRSPRVVARLLLDDPEAGRCDIGSRLFAELQALRELNERRELELAKQLLEARVEQKELLLKEVNHWVKNSLQVVASLICSSWHLI
jgi:two-component sensor histidine kinase